MNNEHKTQIKENPLYANLNPNGITIDNKIDTIKWFDTKNIIHFQSSFYGAEYWYKDLEGFTPRSKLILLSQEDIELITNIDNKTFTTSTCNKIQLALDNELHFIKSSKKSSHTQHPVYTLQECINEIGNYSDVLISLENGCRWLFMRKYIKNISEEYRVIIYNGKITYMEQYLVNYIGMYMNTINAKQMKTELINFVNKILPILHYKDATLDIARTKEKFFIIIKVNIPQYLISDLGDIDIYNNIEYIPFRYMSIYNIIDEV
jgi:hypothetical protein